MSKKRNNKRGARKSSSMLVTFMLILGVCLLAYPTVSNLLAEQERSKVMSMYDTTVQELGESILDKEYSRAQEYNEKLLNGTAVVTDPFDPDNVKASDKDYWEALNLAGDGVMGYLSIPCIDAKLPMYHGTADDELIRGLGHLQGTSLPVGGKSSHCVLAGHTGLPSARILDDLEHVQEGDIFIISVLGRDLAYEVCDIQVVLPDKTDSLVVQKGRDLVTLVTCTPYGVNSHRLLVTGERCDLPDWWNAEESASSVMNWDIPLWLIALLALVLAILFGFILAKLRNKKKDKDLSDGEPIAPLPADKQDGSASSNNLGGDGR